MGLLVVNVPQGSAMNFCSPTYMTGTISSNEYHSEFGPLNLKITPPGHITLITHIHLVNQSMHGHYPRKANGAIRLHSV